jgi:hypothetical protein
VARAKVAGNDLDVAPDLTGVPEPI